MAAEITATFLHLTQPPTTLSHKSVSFSFSINGPDRICRNSRSFYCSHRRNSVRVSSCAVNRDKDDEFLKRIKEFVQIEAESRMNHESDSGDDDGGLYASSSSSSPVFDTESTYHTSETRTMRPDEIDLRVNCFDLPLSIRIMKQKRKKQRKSTDLTDSAYSAVKKAFSSMVFIVRELQSHTIRMRDALFSSSNIQIHGILARVHEEVHSSFVWLFQHIFSTTPTLMVYLMLLLANFTVFSITDYPASAKTLTQSVSASVEEYRNPTSFDSYAVKSFSAVVGGRGGSGGGNTVKPVSGGSDDGSKFSFHNSRTISPVSEKKQDYEKAWKGIMEEADRIRGMERHEVLMDLDTLRLFVSPVRVEIEEDDLSAFAATDFSYRRALAEGFDDPLILCNFAQFLYVVLRDHDSAEKYFKRAALAEPADPEALSRYANFLWLARKDLEAAEETFLEAIAADPGNSYYSANYAHFLWSTGGEDTCYPLHPWDS